MDDRTVRVALQRHWDASDAGDFKLEHEIYREDAVLDYPQSGERIRGRHNIQESRFVQPNKKRLRSGELSAVAISGSLNSYLPMTAYHLTR
jgi:ketosteroid isomerase-like protein